MYLRITYIKLHSAINVSLKYIGFQQALKKSQRVAGSQIKKVLKNLTRNYAAVSDKIFNIFYQHIYALTLRNESHWLHDLPSTALSPSLREIYWTTLCRGVGRRSMLHNALMKHDSLTQQDETFRSVVTDTECSSLSPSSILSAALPPASTFPAAMLMRRLLINQNSFEQQLAPSISTICLCKALFCTFLQDYRENFKTSF